MNIDASDLRRLSADLGKIGGATTKTMFAVFEKGAEELRDEWRRNARQTSGKAAKRYPATITARPKLALRGIEFEVGPDARVNRQANLGAILEFGTATNPPHLDGQRAADATAPKLEKRIEDALAGVATFIETGDETKLYEYTTKAGVTRMATAAQIANWTRGQG